MQSYCEKATFYRAALLLGLVPGETVVQWAHDVIERAPAVPAPFLDIVLCAPGDLTALRQALQPISDEAESSTVLGAILDLAADDLTAGRRSIKDTVMVLSQVRRFLAAAPRVREELDSLEAVFMLAHAGIVGNVASIDVRVREWLMQFAGSAEALRAPRS